MENVLLYVSILVLFICCFFFGCFVISELNPCLLDHFAANLFGHDFCSVCGEDLRLPLCECGARAKEKGYCTECGFFFGEG